MDERHVDLLTEGNIVVKVIDETQKKYGNVSVYFLMKKFKISKRRASEIILFLNTKNKR